MEKRIWKGVEYQMLPQFNGNSDLYLNGGRAYVMEAGNGSAPGLYCAWDKIEVDDRGVKVRNVANCRSLPEEDCGHNVSISVCNLHYLVRTAKVVLSYLKSEGLYVAVKMPDVVRVMGRLKEEYYPNEDYNLGMFCSQHANCFRYLRTHEGAGRSYRDMRKAMAREEQRNHSLRTLIEDIKKMAMDQASRSSVPLESLVNHRMQAVRELLTYEAEKLGMKLVGADFISVTPDGVIKTVSVD